MEFEHGYKRWSSKVSWCGVSKAVKDAEFPLRPNYNRLLFEAIKFPLLLTLYEFLFRREYHIHSFSLSANLPHRMVKLLSKQQDLYSMKSSQSLPVCDTEHAV